MIRTLKALSFVTLACLSLAACQPESSKKTDSLTKAIGAAPAAPTVQKIQFGGILNAAFRHNALAFVPQGEIKSALVVSPGAKISPSAMSDFAVRLANQGVAVYVVEYLLDLAILQQNIAFELAKELKTAPEKVGNLAPSLLAAHKKGLDTSLFGHSLGGAVLANRIDSNEAAFVKSWILFGVSSVTAERQTGRAQSEVVLMTGSKDGLVSNEETAKMETLFGNIKTTFVQDVTHFCIANNDKAGDPKKRKEEKQNNLKKSPPVDPNLSAQECQDAVANAVLKFL